MPKNITKKPRRPKAAGKIRIIPLGGIGEIGGLAQRPAVAEDEGVRADDQRVGVRIRRRVGFAPGVLLGQEAEIREIGQLLRRNGRDGEIESAPRQQFPAARRSGGEDEARHLSVSISSTVGISAGAAGFSAGTDARAGRPSSASQLSMRRSTFSIFVMPKTFFNSALICSAAAP